MSIENRQLYNFIDGFDNGTSVYDIWKQAGHEGGPAEFLEFMRKANVPTNTSELTNDSGYVVIDDNDTNNEKTWSSSKIKNEVDAVEEKLGGTVEITSGNPSKANTVMTIDPSAEEINVYSADEVDAITDKLADKADDMQRQINVERARINTFTALGEGSTTSDAELEDARIDKDGNTHANVGEHIRTVTNELNEKLVQETDKLSEKIGEVKETLVDLEDNIFETENKFISQNYAEWEKYEGYASATSFGVSFAPHDNYDSYIKIFDKETVICCNNPSNATENSIVVGENAGEWNTAGDGIPCTNSIRYRADGTPLPTKDSPLTIPNGAIVVITTTDISSFEFYEFGEVKEKLNKNIKLNYSQIQQVLSNDGLVSIAKTSDTLFTIDFGKYSTTLQRKDHTGDNAHLWNLLGIYYGSDNLITGDIIGPIKEIGESDFMGGYHGDEENIVCLITCDGEVWDRTTKRECKEINIHLKSKLFRVSSKEYIFDRYINIRITWNKIEIENLHKCLVDGFQMERATTGGLMGMSNTYLQAVVMNNYMSETPPTERVYNHSKDNVSATFYWTNGSITLNNIIGHERESYRGFDNVFANETPIRNKIYFDTVSDLVKAKFDNGDTLLGKFEMIFN